MLGPWRLAVAVFALLLVAAGCRRGRLPVVEETTREVAAGRIIYQRKCSTCHGASGNGKTITAGRFPHANLTDGVWRSDGSAAAIERQIREGHDPMPKFQGKLTDEEIRQTVAFILELSRSGGTR